ncbi:uncharacterized protein LOC110608654 isoform X2 [Manihot esculenta]|uniref:uncharacterized protein LOC110608654 isoform X2 n=1 Tax=Manihot esculenta TaxID=3983 RepID=UPI001CC7ADAA|nr:uncharacterized protein LOC110608654 isoform X2 [Manihot esculenta]
MISVICHMCNLFKPAYILFNQQQAAHATDEVVVKKHTEEKTETGVSSDQSRTSCQSYSTTGKVKRVEESSEKNSNVENELEPAEASEPEFSILEAKIFIYFQDKATAGKQGLGIKD